MRALMFMSLWLVACDTSAQILPIRRVFLDAHVVSAWAAKRDAAGAWTPVCRPDDGAAEGIVTSVVLLGSQPREAPDLPADPDVSIRPGDIIDTRIVDGPNPFDVHFDGGAMTVALTCLDPLAEAEPNPTDDPASCEGTVPSAALDSVAYASHTTARGVANEVLILIDMSGSLSGLVHADSLLEPQPAGYSDLPSDLRVVASDASARRITAAQNLIRSLGPNDRVAVLLFGESVGGGAGLAVPCGAGSGMAASEGLAQCFGTNHDQWLGEHSLLSTVGGRTMGRSNLWRAIDFAYTFMADAARPRPRGASRHIVVLTDGPDTCNGDALTPGSSPCSNVLAGAVADRLAAARTDPDAADVHLHFVQFEAPGYPGRDAAQVTAACLTEGHYRFIDTNTLHDRASDLATAFGESALDVRYTFMGEWRVSASVAALADVEQARAYALGGQLIITPDSGFVTTTTTFGFADDAVWDRRPTIVAP